VNRKVSSEKPFPSHHPHARKQSVQWNAVENTPPPTAHSSPHPLSLDPINETELSNSPLTPGLASPAIGGPSEPPPPHAAPGVASSTANPSPRGLGIEFPSESRIGKRTGPKSASAGNLPIQGAETLLWAYAQVSGSVEIDQDTVDYSSLSNIRTKLARSGPIGGGRMDLHDRTPNSAPPTDGSWSSFFGLPSLSPYRNTSSSPSSFLSNMVSARSSSARMAPPSPSGAPNALTTFNPPQSMLAVDLTLGPGESKTCTRTFSNQQEPALIT
jgi:RAB6A-GEF complex partner protein 2